jgi:hypothetical protein
LATQVGDIAAALAYQVKKEIAENYFGTRRELEEEREDLISQAKRLQKAWVQEVQAPLTLLGELLLDPDTVKSFLALLGQEHLRLAAQDSPDRTFAEAVEACSLPFAWTSQAKYQALIAQLYGLAWGRSQPLLEKVRALEKKVRLYNEDLVKFSAAYSLQEILAFIKAIEGSSELNGVLGENTDPRAVPELEKKMMLKSLDPSGLGLSEVKPLPKLSQIREPLRALVKQAFGRNGGQIKSCLRRAESRF